MTTAWFVWQRRFQFISRDSWRWAGGEKLPSHSSHQFHFAISRPMTWHFPHRNFIEKIRLTFWDGESRWRGRSHTDTPHTHRHTDTLGRDRAAKWTTGNLGVCVCVCVWECVSVSLVWPSMWIQLPRLQWQERAILDLTESSTSTPVEPRYRALGAGLWATRWLLSYDTWLLSWHHNLYPFYYDDFWSDLINTVSWGFSWFVGGFFCDRNEHWWDVCGVGSLRSREYWEIGAHRRRGDGRPHSAEVTRQLKLCVRGARTFTLVRRDFRCWLSTPLPPPFLLWPILPLL